MVQLITRYHTRTLECYTVCNNRKSDANCHFSSKLHSLAYISCPDIFQGSVDLSISEGLGCWTALLYLGGSQSSRSPVITLCQNWEGPAYFSHLLCSKLCIQWPVQFLLLCEKEYDTTWSIHGGVDMNEAFGLDDLHQPYTLFQNGHHFIILLFSCKLALVASFLNSKFKRIFSLKRGNKDYCSATTGFSISH